MSCGQDGMCNSLIKLVIKEISDPLTHIFNSSFETGIFPDQMKIAKVIPIHKGGDKTLMGNYRPISILPTVSKLLERIVSNRLRTFIEKRKLLYDNQFGFRNRHSTELAILTLKDEISKNIDDGLFTVGILLDFSKAFDTVDHEILLTKLIIMVLEVNP